MVMFFPPRLPSSGSSPANTPYVYMQGACTRAQVATAMADAIAAGKSGVLMGPGTYTWDATTLPIVTNGFHIKGVGEATVINMVGGAVNNTMFTIGTQALSATVGLFTDALTGTRTISMAAGAVAALGGLVVGDLIAIEMTSLPGPATNCYMKQIARVTAVGVGGTNIIEIADTLERRYYTAALAYAPSPGAVLGHSATTVRKLTTVYKGIEVGNFAIYGNGNSGTLSHGIVRYNAERCKVHDVYASGIPQAAVYTDMGYFNRENNIHVEACGDANYSDFYALHESQQQSSNITSLRSTGFGPQWRGGTGLQVRGLISQGAAQRGSKFESLASFSLDQFLVEGAGRINPPNGNGLGITLGCNNGAVTNGIVRNNPQNGFWTSGYGAGRLQAANVIGDGNGNDFGLLDDGVTPAFYTSGDVKLYGIRGSVSNGIGAVIV